jgi:hypothetical protein
MCVLADIIQLETHPTLIIAFKAIFKLSTQLFSGFVCIPPGSVYGLWGQNSFVVALTTIISSWSSSFSSRRRRRRRKGIGDGTKGIGDGTSGWTFRWN